MTSLRDRVRTFFTPSSPGTSTVGRAGTPVRIRHNQPIHRTNRPIWHVKGWRQDGQRFFGAYRAGRQFYDGEILVDSYHPTQPYQCYIVRPPLAVLAGPHSPCFSGPLNDAGRYRVHLTRPAQNVEEAIHAVETLLRTEARI